MTSEPCYFQSSFNPHSEIVGEGEIHHVDPNNCYGYPETLSEGKKIHGIYVDPNICYDYPGNVSEGEFHGIHSGPRPENDHWLCTGTANVRTTSCGTQKIRYIDRHLDVEFDNLDELFPDFHPNPTYYTETTIIRGSPPRPQGHHDDGKDENDDDDDDGDYPIGGIPLSELGRKLLRQWRKAVRRQYENGFQLTMEPYRKKIGEPDCSDVEDDDEEDKKRLREYFKRRCPTQQVISSKENKTSRRSTATTRDSSSLDKKTFRDRWDKFSKQFSSLCFRMVDEISNGALSRDGSKKVHFHSKKKTAWKKLFRVDKIRRQFS